MLGTDSNKYGNRHLILTSVATLGALLSACGSSGPTPPQSTSVDQPDDPWNPCWERIRTDDIRPDESDYPQLNPHSARTLEIVGTMPKELRIELLIAFRAVGAAEGGPSSGKYCGYKQNSESFPDFSVREVAPIVRVGEGFHATVQLDKYLPGRCQWHFDGLGYRVNGGTGVLSEESYAAPIEARSGTMDPDRAYRGQIDEWCKLAVTGNKDDPTAATPVRCGYLVTLQLAAKIDPAVIARIPLAERNREPRTWIFPDTKKVEIDFHNIDQYADGVQ